MSALDFCCFERVARGDAPFLRVDPDGVREIGWLGNLFTRPATHRKSIERFLDFLKAHYGERIFTMAKGELKAELRRGKALSSRRVRAILDLAHAENSPLAVFEHGLDPLSGQEIEHSLERAFAVWCARYPAHPPLSETEQAEWKARIAACLFADDPPASDLAAMYQAVSEGRVGPMAALRETLSRLLDQAFAAVAATLCLAPPGFSIETDTPKLLAAIETRLLEEYTRRCGSPRDCLPSSIVRRFRELLQDFCVAYLARCRILQAALPDQEMCARLAAAALFVERDGACRLIGIGELRALAATCEARRLAIENAALAPEVAAFLRSTLIETRDGRARIVDADLLSTCLAVARRQDAAPAQTAQNARLIHPVYFNQRLSQALTAVRICHEFDANNRVRIYAPDKNGCGSFRAIADPVLTALYAQVRKAMDAALSRPSTDVLPAITPPRHAAPSLSEAAAEQALTTTLAEWTGGLAAANEIRDPVLRAWWVTRLVTTPPLVGRAYVASLRPLRQLDSPLRELAQERIGLAQWQEIARDLHDRAWQIAAQGVAQRDGFADALALGILAAKLSPATSLAIYRNLDAKDGVLGQALRHLRPDATPWILTALMALHRTLAWQLDLPPETRRRVGATFPRDHEELPGAVRRRRGSEPALAAHFAA